MQIQKHNGIYAMTDHRFSVDGVDFIITGTKRITDHEHGDYHVCDIKNLSNGKTSTMEHQDLCKLLMKKLNLKPINIGR